MNRKAILVVVLLVTIIGLACISFFKKQSLKVGIITYLTGENSDMGISGRNGISLAIDEINKTGGLLKRDVELIIKDHEGSKELCLARTKELVKEGVFVIIGPIVSNMAQYVIEGIEGSDVLIIAPTVSTDDFTGIDDNFLRIAAPSSLQGQYLGEMINKLNKTNIVVIMDRKNESYTKGVAKSIKEYTDSIDIYFSTNDDFENIVKDLESINPDGIVFVTNGIDGATIIQMYGKNNEIPQLFGSSWVRASSIEQYGGRAIEGMILVDSYTSNPAPPKQIEFLESYKNKFHTQGDSISMYFYESLFLYKIGVEKANSFYIEDVKAAILGFKEIEGITENYHLDGFGDGVKTLQLLEIRDNEYVILQRSR